MVFQVFQRRMDGSENFYRSWAEYASGFGDIHGEHWLTKIIHVRWITEQIRDVHPKLMEC